MTETKTVEPRILITSNSHEFYDRTATIVEDHGEYLIVDLGNGQQCRVDNGQFKLTKV